MVRVKRGQAVGGGEDEGVARAQHEATHYTREAAGVLVEVLKVMERSYVGAKVLTTGDHKAIAEAVTTMGLAIGALELLRLRLMEKAREEECAGCKAGDALGDFLSHMFSSGDAGSGGDAIGADKAGDKA